LIRVLALEREELLRDIASYQDELRNILNDPTLTVKVDLENLDKDPATLNKNQMAAWLVEVGLKSLISPEKVLFSSFTLYLKSLSLIAYRVFRT
jgi:hypothetical protein